MKKRFHCFISIIMMALVFTSASDAIFSFKRTPSGINEYIHFTSDNVFFNSVSIEHNDSTRTKISSSIDINDIANKKMPYCLGGKASDKRKINLEIDSLNSVGIITIDINVEADDTNEEINERIYGYPKIDEVGEYDIELDIHGHKVLGKDVVKYKNTYEISEQTLESINTPPLDSYISIDIFSSIVELTLDICDFFSVQSLASLFVDIPTFDIKNPLPYLFYVSKVELTKEHYSHNIAQEKTWKHYIEEQDQLDNFKFGFSEQSIGELDGCNIKYKGCGIIATYNALKDSGANVSFPDLIALYELCGADLFFGYCGVNPIPDYIDEVVKPLITVILFASYSTILQPLLNASLAIVELTVVNILLLQPSLLLKTLGIPTVEVFIAILRTVVNDTGRCISEFIDWYLSFTKSETEILKAFYKNKVYDFPGYAFEGFKNFLSKASQGIICFWNKSDSEGNIIMSSSAHYIYVSREILDGMHTYYFLAHNNGNDKRATIDDLTLLFGPSYSGNQFIWGYVFYD